MAKQTINIGASPNDGTGTPLRTAFDYTNQNFTELYTATGPSGNNIVCPGSATITGDLTVDTNTLFVDSANNYVGIGTASPVQSLTISGEASLRVGDVFYWNGYYNAGFKARAAGYAAYISESGTGDLFFANTASSAAGAGSSLSFLTRYNIDKDGVATWSNVGGVAGTAMTLNANGLGIGVTPVNKLTIGTGTFNASTVSGSSSLYSTVSQGLVILTDGFVVGTRAGVKRHEIDTSGNFISYVTGTAPTLADDGFMVFNLTSNTNLRISVRGTDGVTRTANLTLA